ncbi:MAG: hypothetical protein HON98_06235 [Chloroflexi bacterium]|jgi:hypothetical protein|nr:hypothetical protein [Chloroflexota bacterium]MBT3669503.1 hypothetical protein [Chloroflexota bacterium]MBT4002440.1 hypothetical protein [Chloroflexota bacterium]MBT4304478.1 hypothetical protein [Chloroflexota bacterium]MBT4534181.1 hypothetical protein [Chloroflexota bacterium]
MKIFPKCLLVLLMMLIPGCTSANGNLPTDLPVPSTITPIVIQPTNTPIPDQTPVILFYSDPDSEESLKGIIDTTLQNISDQNSMVLEFRTDINNLNLPENLFALVILSEMENLTGLDEISSDIKVIRIGSTGGNIDNAQQVHIGINENGLAIEGFIAGYIAAMQTEEWRIGMIGLTSNNTNQVGFINGVKYFCGLCSPIFPPYEAYPLYTQVNDGSEFVELKIAADLLLQKAVNTIYLAPGVNNPELKNYLSQMGIKMIGNGEADDVGDGYWIATVRWDWNPVIEEVLPKAILGDFSGNGAPDILVGNVNDISPSRLVLVSELIEYLTEGIVDPIGK